MISSLRAASLSLVVSCAIVAACSSGTTGTGVADGGASSGTSGTSGSGTSGTSGAGTSGTSGSGTSGTSGNTGGCGLVLTGPRWAATCQAWSDQYCCAQQKACAADSACAKLVACIEACPTPRQDAFLNACTPAGGNAELFTAFGACSKATPAGGQDIPASCEWPTGG